MYKINARTDDSIVEENKIKRTPAYLALDYPYQAISENITDLNSLVQGGILYEIKCPKCEMSIRAQGCNIKPTYERWMNENGCIGCGNKDLVVKMVDTSGMNKIIAEE